MASNGITLSVKARIERAYLARDWTGLKKIALDLSDDVDCLRKESFARQVVATTVTQILTNGLQSFAKAVSAKPAEKKGDKKES